MNRRTLLMTAGAAGLIATPLAGCAKPEAGAPEAPFADIEQAFYYAFPLYEFARTDQARAGAKGGGLNMINERAHLSTWEDRGVTAPNNDTIYMSAFLDLSGGPLEVVCPSNHERYFVLAFMDAFTDNFAYVGTRATGGDGGRFWVVGPQWSGDAPAGVTVFKATTNDVWMLMRTLVDGPDDLAAAQSFHRQLKLIIPEDRAPTKPFTNAATSNTDPANFLAVANEVLARSPGGQGQTARAARFATFGIGAEGPPSPELLTRWGEFLPQGIDKLKEAFLFSDNIVDGWSYQPSGVGNFGENDKLRAAVALGGLAALGEEEAMYFHANFDRQGNRLSGEKAWRWRVPPGGVPADAFWSLTMYEASPDGRFFLVKNPIDRYSIGDRTPGLVVGPDGSFEILIQKDKPEGPLAANWLPAPEGTMRLALRAYLPREELRKRQWRVPALEEAV